MKDDILSIDVDAHLEKLVTGTYRSRAYYPVELVRSALKRGAEKIQIQIEKSKFAIQDDGQGIDRSQMEKVKSLLEPSGADESREQAIIDLQAPEGIGLLCLFSPSPVQIELSSSSHSQEHRLLFRRGALLQFLTCNRGPGERGTATGTNIVLTRKGWYWEQEIQILSEYCRGVQKEILLNGRLISKKSLIRNSLVSIRIDQPSSGVSGEIGIPEQGDVCRFWLLDRGIPLFRKIIAPWKGLVFDAALEYTGEINGKLLNGISNDVLYLYQYLIRNRGKFSRSHKRRIEELIFKHHRLSSSRVLVDEFPVFYSVSDHTYHSFAQLRRLSPEHILYVIPEQKNAEEYDLTGKTVFQLSEQQIDYLVSHFAVPVEFLPHRTRPGKIKNLFSSFREKSKETLGKIHPGRKRPIPAEHLTGPEKKLIFLLSGYREEKFALESELPHFSKIDFIPGRGLFPGFILREEMTLAGNHREILLIHRFHPIVRSAVMAIEQNPENIEFVGPLFY